MNDEPVTGDLVPLNDNRPVRAADAVNDRTAERITAAVPENTTRSYRRAWQQFEQWCTDNDRQPVPTSAATLADYVTHLADADRSPNTIKHDMGVISAQNQTAGYPPLGKDTTKAANLVLRGHRNDRAEQGKRVKQAPPITRERLAMLSAACDRATLAGRRDRLLLVVGFAMAGRRSELAALRMSDVRLDGENGLEILIRKSKTDKDAEGAEINLPPGAHVDTDPVGLFHDWLTALTEHGQDTTTGALFRAVTKHDTLYRYGSITPAAVNGIVRRAARRAGLPGWERYSAHSLRAGFATQAAMDGIPMPLWARHGRWDEKSPVPHGYVRAADRRNDNPLKRMGL